VTTTRNTTRSIVWIAGVSIIAGIFYWLTACRSVGYIDSGELATACYYLGIPHPTGYPLYVNFGRLAVILFPGTIIWRCTLLSLLITAASTGVLFSLIKMVLGKAKTNIPNAVAVSISLFMAFTPVWWAQGTTNEVYCLTLLLSLLALLALVKYVSTKLAKYLLACFYLLGLSFGTHLSTIFLLPAVIYLIISAEGIKNVFKPRYLWAVALFALSLSIYVYLPIRAEFKPFLNWSDPGNIQGLLNHIGGWQYRVWMFKSFAKMLDGVVYFGKLLYQQFGVWGITLVIIGAFSLFKTKLKLAIFFSLIIIADILYSANYEIVDIESYYLLAFASLAIFGAAGLYAIAEALIQLKSFKGYIRALKIGLMVVFAALPITNFAANYKSCDGSQTKYVKAGVTNILESMEPNGIALVENWDFYSPWLYFHYIENIRPDAVLIDKELLRRSWYIDFLRRYHPDIMDVAQSEIDAFLVALKPFESGGQYDSRQLTVTFTAMIDTLINKNIDRRPIYTNFAGDDMFVFKQKKIPTGSLYKLENKSRYIPFDIAKIDITPWESLEISPDRRTKATLFYTYKITRDRALFCRQLGYESEAQSYMGLSNRIKAVLDRPE
jgi:hypothetical protein